MTRRVRRVPRGSTICAGRPAGRRTSPSDVGDRGEGGGACTARGDGGPPLDRSGGGDGAARLEPSGQARLTTVVTGRPKRRSTWCGTSDPSQRETRLGRVATMTSSK